LSIETPRRKIASIFADAAAQLAIAGLEVKLRSLM
jgi:hypothetical protein